MVGALVQQLAAWMVVMLAAWTGNKRACWKVALMVVRTVHMSDKWTVEWKAL